MGSSRWRTSTMRRWCGDYWSFRYCTLLSPLLSVHSADLFPSFEQYLAFYQAQVRSCCRRTPRLARRSPLDRSNRRRKHRRQFSFRPTPRTRASSFRSFPSLRTLFDVELTDGLFAGSIPVQVPRLPQPPPFRPGPLDELPLLRQQRCFVRCLARSHRADRVDCAQRSCKLGRCPHRTEQPKVAVAQVFRLCLCFAGARCNTQDLLGVKANKISLVRSLLSSDSLPH
jgi:hypothetical protein